MLMRIKPYCLCNINSLLVETVGLVARKSHHQHSHLQSATRQSKETKRHVRRFWLLVGGGSAKHQVDLQLDGERQPEPFCPIYLSDLYLLYNGKVPSLRTPIPLIHSVLLLLLLLLAMALILPLNCILLIIVPIIAVCILVVTFFLLLILRQPSPAKAATSSSSSSFKNQHSNPQYIGFSPDVRRSCIYCGKLGGLTAREKKRGGQVFTYKELELATDGFSERNVIGNGGFGRVFRGTLSDGTVAAIKMLHREGKQGEREFRMEVDLLNRLNSSHLVGLLGYCADQHYRLLVLEFMPNGSLQQHLHPSSHSRHHRPLDWATRLRIALDCARGLEFLHEYTVPAVIHRDFKCSNILLDHNLRAKVSDFGMAKMGSDKVNGQVVTRVLGTSGYVAPEYASTGRLTTKSDVYSYGVVLLELLTGRVPVDTSGPPGEHVLVSWALPRLTNRDMVVEMVDPALDGQFSRKELIQVAAIAAVCVQSEAAYRPLITDVVQSLIPFVKSTSPTSTTLHQQITVPAA